MRAKQAAATALAEEAQSQDAAPAGTPHPPSDSSCDAARLARPQSASLLMCLCGLGSGAGGAGSAELLVMSWHAAGAQHWSLDEPSACLAAYEKAHDACAKHGDAVRSQPPPCLSPILSFFRRLRIICGLALRGR